jgi:histidine ammonia-lyase
MINYLSKGYSGIRFETIETLVQMLNKRVHPLVPEKGSVGSSGDLAPSAHIALVLIGKGEAEYKNKIMSGEKAMKLAGIKPIRLSSKEGLAIINNTCAMTSISSLLLYDTQWLIKLSSIASALSIQALRGTDMAYDPRIHQLKPHKGQIETAKELRNLLKGSTFLDRKRVQDSYSFRCVPQVHGAVREAFDYVSKVVNIETNSVTDNPLVFPSPEPEPQVLSGGNFHREPVAIAMDTLGIALSELGNISERRIATLIDPNLNNGLPAFLTENGGLNSGFMITQYLAASLVSENKVLAHPASVDSIPTSANVEDIVSMGTIAARKAREIFENTANILAIELIAACQAIDIRKRKEPSLKLSKNSEKVYNFVRKTVPYFEKDKVFYPYIKLIRSKLEKIAELV